MFAREGCRGVTISHLLEEAEDAANAKWLIEDSGAQVNLVECNLEQESACKSLVESHLKIFGTLNILVNNASKQMLCKSLEEIVMKNVESTFKSNILQMFAVTKYAIPHLKRGASIINTTSVTSIADALLLIDSDLS